MNKQKQFRRKKQMLTVIISYIIICIFWLLIIQSIFKPKQEKYEYEFKEYTISKGERLWDIAKTEIANNTYYNNEDIRQVVYEIKQDNNIKSTIYPGQVIKIRIKKDELSKSTNQSDIDNTPYTDLNI